MITYDMNTLFNELERHEVEVFMSARKQLSGYEVAVTLSQNLNTESQSTINVTGKGAAFYTAFAAAYDQLTAFTDMLEGKVVPPAPPSDDDIPF